MAALRMITAGESHGPGLTCVIEGLPGGLVLDRAAINRDMARRQLGHGRGGRMKIESDAAAATGGGRLERASPRERAARVAGGAVCKAFLAALGVEVVSHVTRIGTVAAAGRAEPLVLADFATVDASPVRCLDDEASRAMVEHIDRQRKANESLGGIFEVRAFGLVPGLGSHVSWEQRLDGRLAEAICSIQAIKAFELGDGIALAEKPGSQAHDEIFYTPARGFYRETNRSGGVEGGMTNGQPLIVRGMMKPLPTLTKPLRSVDVETHAPGEALRERTDSCTVPAAGVVGEAMVAFVLARAYREKFGGDHLDDVRGALAAYSDRIGWGGA